jgi:hypothetical protein
MDSSDAISRCGSPTLRQVRMCSIRSIERLTHHRLDDHIQLDSGVTSKKLFIRMSRSAGEAAAGGIGTEHGVPKRTSLATAAISSSILVFTENHYEKEFSSPPPDEGTLRAMTDSLEDISAYATIIREDCEVLLYSVRGDPIAYIRCPMSVSEFMSGFKLFDDGRNKPNNKRRNAFHALRLSRDKVGEYGLRKGCNRVPDGIVERLCQLSLDMTSQLSVDEYWRGLTFYSIRARENLLAIIDTLRSEIELLSTANQDLQKRLDDRQRAWDKHWSLCPMNYFRKTDQ